jgi:hypothetical protein
MGEHRVGAVQFLLARQGVRPHDGSRGGIERTPCTRARTRTARGVLWCSARQALELAVLQQLAHQVMLWTEKGRGGGGERGEYVCVCAPTHNTKQKQEGESGAAGRKTAQIKSYCTPVVMQGSREGFEGEDPRARAVD